ncbi:uncharacterized protein LOC111392050 [Olea europaea var. sylvestris]|uniref:uncharacterized protein LOC111392050 n=1 Tax=Olea europaea var. sylvestris TaxID=158386 RepID=UPI000C1D4AF1|nr:uncharacterized protein LOC111392050 [Olea europaea var. sylvestris]
MVRSMMSFTILTTSFWGYALEIAPYVLNLVISKSVHKTPLEMWIGSKSSLRHIQIWECSAHVLKGKAEKLESRSKICLFVGYPKSTRGYYCYKPQLGRQSLALKIPKQCILNERDESLSNLIDQVNIEGIEKVMALPNGDTNIDTNVKISNDAKVQDSSLLI